MAAIRRPYRSSGLMFGFAIQQSGKSIAIVSMNRKDILRHPSSTNASELRQQLPDAQWIAHLIQDKKTDTVKHEFQPYAQVMHMNRLSRM
jgi:anaerobic glycerol-3-phosphate dehydrogenase